MILRPKACDKFYSRYVKSKHDWSCLYNFSLITFAQICSLTDHLLPNVRDAVEAAAEGARDGVYRGGGDRRRGGGGIKRQGRMLHLSSRRVFGGIYHHLSKILCHRESLQRKNHLRIKVSTRKNPIQKGHQLRRLTSPKCLQRNMVHLKLKLPVRGRLYLKRRQVNH